MHSRMLRRRDPSRQNNHLADALRAAAAYFRGGHGLGIDLRCVALVSPSTPPLSDPLYSKVCVFGQVAGDCPAEAGPSELPCEGLASFRDHTAISNLGLGLSRVLAVLRKTTEASEIPVSSSLLELHARSCPDDATLTTSPQCKESMVLDLLS